MEKILRKSSPLPLQCSTSTAGGEPFDDDAEPAKERNAARDRNRRAAAGSPELARLQ